MQADTAADRGTPPPSPEVVRPERTPVKVKDHPSFPKDIKPAPTPKGAVWEDQAGGSRAHLDSALTTQNKGGGLTLFLDDGVASVVERPSSAMKRSLSASPRKKK